MTNVFKRLVVAALAGGALALASCSCGSAAGSSCCGTCAKTCNKAAAQTCSHGGK